MVTLVLSQLKAMSEIFQLMDAGVKRIVLKGSAGVGKTTLVNELVKISKRDRYSYGAIYILAPTHKALNVLRDKLEWKYPMGHPLGGQEKSYIKFKTVHGGLKLKRKKDYHTGKETFEKDKYDDPKNPPLQAAQLVILDEASMLGTYLLNGDGGIHEFPNITFLFLGDPKQLPPVGETSSPVFTQGWATVELNEPIRQKVGNPIIDLSYNLNLLNKKVSNINEKGEGYFFESNRDKLVEKLAQANGTDDIKYLAFTNDEVNAMNKSVREKIYGNPDKLEIGECVIFDEPYEGINGESYKTSQEVRIKSLETISYQLKVPNENTTIQYSGGKPTIKESRTKNYDDGTVLVYIVNNDFLVLHEKSEQTVKDWLKRIYSLGNSGAIPMSAYHMFKEQSKFAQIKYNHALTVHKSQGSTYGISIVNARNMRIGRDIKDALLYTSITRASKLVAIYG